MVDNKNKENSKPSPRNAPNSTPFEERGSKEVPPASYDPPVIVPKQPSSK